MSYWSYYLVWFFLAYAMRRPLLLLGVVVFLILRRFIPDPTAVFRALSRGRVLRSQCELNPANITARRDLAQIYLDVLRPRAALARLEQALVRAPNDPELLFLSGLARHRVGRHEDALAPLVRAVELDPRVRFGLPYLIAGDALFALGRTEAAVDAYERYADSNSSDVLGHVRLARAQARLGDRAAAARAIAEGLSTWRMAPSRLKRRTFLRGYLAAQWARVWLLREPGAVAVALLLAASTAVALRAAYPALVQVAREQRRPHARHQQTAANEMPYLGETIKLTKAYDDYDTYKNDPNNIDPSELPRIERLMTQAKIGPTFTDYRDFVEQESELVFPGYGLGPGPRIASPGRELISQSLEIPGANKERILVLEKLPDQSLTLIDDFVAAGANSPRFPSRAELKGDTLVYYAADHSELRQFRVALRP